MPKKRKEKKAAQRLAPGPPHTPPELLSPSPKILDQNAFAKVHDEVLREHLAKLSEPADLVKASEQLVNSLMAGISKDNTPAGSTLALSLFTARALQALFTRISMGDQLAAKRLYGVLRSSVEQLNHHAIQNPTAYLEIAGVNLQWPVLYSPNEFFNTDVDAVQEKLKIARDYRLNLFGAWVDRKRAYDLRLPQNWLALTILEKLTSARSALAPSSEVGEEPEWKSKSRHLPPLSRGTADEWAKVGWKAVLDFYHNHPEADPYLAQLGNSLRKTKTKGQVRGRIQAQFTEAVRHLAQRHVQQ